MMRELRIVSALVALSAGFNKKETISVSSLGLIRSEGTLSKRYKFHRQLPAVDLEVQLQCNIFSLWEKPSHLQQQPLFERLVLEAWRRHSDGLCKEPILVTDENVRELIPDIPEEYFRLPYPAAKSDFIRYAVLYHHGGVYIDFDMLTVKDVDDIVEKAKALDLVSYSEGRDGGDCKGFSSNLLGGRKNSSFHLAVWEAQKAAVTQHCNLSEKTLEKASTMQSKSATFHGEDSGSQFRTKCLLLSPPSLPFALVEMSPSIRTGLNSFWSTSRSWRTPRGSLRPAKWQSLWRGPHTTSSMPSMDGRSIRVRSCSMSLLW